MSLALIREAIDELSDEDRAQLAEWLAETTVVEDDESDLQLVQERLESLENGARKLVSETEMWKRVESIKAGLQ